MRILVTGGLGFIGTNLTRTLCQAGHKVTCIDNLVTGQYEHLAYLKSYGDVEFIQHDVAQPLPIKLEVDAIYNLACAASPELYQRDPLLTTKTCVLGALHMLELATQLNIPILQASTSEIYGDPLENPQRESYWGHVNPIGIRACYDEGKRCAESLFFDYHRVHGTKIKVVRIFNTYGPFMRTCDGRVVSNFIIQALTGRNLTIHGDGSQTRSFCFVDDLVPGLIAMMNTPDKVLGPLNLGNPRSCTISELAHKVVYLTKSTSGIIYDELPQDDPKQRQPDITLAKQILKWEPTLSLEEGLKKTTTYFAQALGNVA
jgi:UDP-glucuronate decarboxylase